MKTLLTSLITSIALALIPAGASAAADDIAKGVDTKVQTWMVQRGVASAVIAVSYKSFAIASYAHPVTGSPTTSSVLEATASYPVGSLSKAITAACLAPFIDSKAINLDDTLGHILSGYFAKAGDPKDIAVKDIKLSELLTHTSGLARNFFGQPHTLDAAVANLFGSENAINYLTEYAQAHKLRPNGFSYSNNGYMLLGFIIGQVLVTTPGKTANQRYFERCRDALRGATGTIDPAIPERAGNGAWDISVAGYSQFLFSLDASSGALGEKTLTFLTPKDTITKHFGVMAGYSLGTFVVPTKKGFQYFHDGVPHLPTHRYSLFFINEAGYRAVVTYEGAEGDLGSLLAALRSALTVPDAYVAPNLGSPGYKNISTSGGSTGVSSPCMQGHGTFKKQAYNKMTPTQEEHEEGKPERPCK